MEIMEIAAMLGKAIKEDERVKKMQEAEAAYEADKTITGLMMEYNTQQMALTEQYKQEEQDEGLISAIEARMEELYNEITVNPLFIAYNEAQEAVNAFMNEVNGEITFQITGERPCAHDCSCCGHDCGHHHEEDCDCED